MNYLSGKGAAGDKADRKVQRSHDEKNANRVARGLQVEGVSHNADGEVDRDMVTQEVADLHDGEVDRYLGGLASSGLRMKARPVDELGQREEKHW